MTTRIYASQQGVALSRLVSAYAPASAIISDYIRDALRGLEHDVPGGVAWETLNISAHFEPEFAAIKFEATVQAESADD